MQFEKTLSSDEVAKLLGLHRVTLCRKTAAGEIPGFKAGKCWRYNPCHLMAWARAQYGPRALQGLIDGD